MARVLFPIFLLVGVKSSPEKYFYVEFRVEASRVESRPLDKIVFEGETKKIIFDCPNEILRTIRLERNLSSAWSLTMAGDLAMGKLPGQNRDAFVMLPRCCVPRERNGNVSNPPHFFKGPG